MKLKKLMAFLFAATVMAPVFADNVDDSIDEIFETQPPVTTVQKTEGAWPVFLAVAEIPTAEKAPDVIGLRLTIPFSTKQESVTGFDVGVWGRTRYFEGFMLNILRNDVKDQLAGLQVGLYNSANQADLLGIQVGLWNEAGSIRGVQAGLINTVDIAQGLQIGLINRAEEMYGFQIGVINVIRDAELQFFPFLNIGF